MDPKKCLWMQLLAKFAEKGKREKSNQRGEDASK